MTNLIVLRGAIENYKVERKFSNFILLDSERGAMGAVAIAAAATGASGLAMGAAVSATSTDEEADYVEFRIEGELVKGWLWRSPFSEGDVVDVVVSKSGDELGLLAVYRPSDQLIALYPHLSRGRRAHAINALKWWAIGSTIVVGLTSLAFAYVAAESGSLWDQFRNRDFLDVILVGGGACYGYFLIYTVWSLRRWRKYTEMAEKIFAALGWKNGNGIDLVKSSKKLQRGEKSFGYGAFFFRR